MEIEENLYNREINVYKIKVSSYNYLVNRIEVREWTLIV